VHFNVCVFDGVFKSTNQGMQFTAAKPFIADFIAQQHHRASRVVIAVGV
jgi:hypothetical protein